MASLSSPGAPGTIPSPDRNPPGHDESFVDLMENANAVLTLDAEGIKNYVDECSSYQNDFKAIVCDRLKGNALYERLCDRIKNF